MQQTADVLTKDQMDVDSDAETTLVSGLSYFFYAVAITAGVQDVADADVVMTAAYGLSSYCSSVAASATTEVAADADATITATKSYLILKASALTAEALHIFHDFFIYFLNVRFLEAV